MWIALDDCVYFLLKWFVPLRHCCQQTVWFKWIKSSTGNDDVDSTGVKSEDVAENNSDDNGTQGDTDSENGLNLPFHQQSSQVDSNL